MAVKTPTVLLPAQVLDVLDYAGFKINICLNSMEVIVAASRAASPYYDLASDYLTRNEVTCLLSQNQVHTTKGNLRIVNAPSLRNIR